MARTPRTKRRAPRRALLVIDMLNGFLDPKGSLYCGDDSRAIIPYIRRRIETYARCGEPVIFACDRHAPDDPEFRLYPAHCVKGTWEARVVPELPVPEGAHVLAKPTLSSFYKTRLHGLLARLAPDEVEVVGVCTNICIYLAVADLVVRGYRVRVPRKGVATFDAKAHDVALEQMASVFGAKVV